MRPRPTQDDSFSSESTVPPRESPHHRRTSRDVALRRASRVRNLNQSLLLLTTTCLPPRFLPSSLGVPPSMLAPRSLPLPKRYRYVSPECIQEWVSELIRRRRRGSGCLLSRCACSMSGEVVMGICEVSTPVSFFSFECIYSPRLPHLVVVSISIPQVSYVTSTGVL